jgi:hypothetical protein
MAATAQHSTPCTDHTNKSASASCVCTCLHYRLCLLAGWLTNLLCRIVHVVLRGLFVCDFLVKYTYMSSCVRAQGYYTTLRASSSWRVGTQAPLFVVLGCDQRVWGSGLKLTLGLGLLRRNAAWQFGRLHVAGDVVCLVESE